mgnify:CR=1 FL=1
MPLIGLQMAIWSVVGASFVLGVRRFYQRWREYDDFMQGNLAPQRRVRLLHLSIFIRFFAVVVLAPLPMALAGVYTALMVVYAHFTWAA